ncbi:MAG TPA: PLDc N-terminal domain-containing protein [Candidatus Pacearchaeota archaeon]|nr:PLDc N-terminal domain-containing protein [Candidatus Pacearchaeota archaeon]
MQLWGTIVGIVAVICAVWVIYDVWTKQKKMKDLEKIVWTVAAIVLSILTAIVYYFVKKK